MLKYFKLTLKKFKVNNKTDKDKNLIFINLKLIFKEN